MTGVEQGRCFGEGEPWLLLDMFGHTCYPLLIIYLFIYSMKMICSKKSFLEDVDCVMARIERHIWRTVTLSY